MKLYRIFLLQQQKIIASHAFAVESDDWACSAAALVFDASADCCDECEIWEGARLLLTSEGLQARIKPAKGNGAEARAEVDPATSERAVARAAATILEAAMKTSEALRASPRLNARLKELRRISAGQDGR